MRILLRFVRGWDLLPGFSDCPHFAMQITGIARHKFDTMVGRRFQADASNADERNMPSLTSFLNQVASALSYCLLALRYWVGLFVSVLA